MLGSLSVVKVAPCFKKPENVVPPLFVKNPAMSPALSIAAAVVETAPGRLIGAENASVLVLNVYPRLLPLAFT
jgi:hypothetical protein